MIISFLLHRNVWGMSPTSSAGQNMNLHDYFFHLQRDRYIKLYEACHPPVLMNKTSAWLFLLCYIELYEACHLPVVMKKNKQTKKQKNRNFEK